MDNASHQMEFGQFFTTNETLLDAVHRFIKNDPPIILEPCCGRGDIVNHLLQHPDRAFTTFDLYEIDTSIELLPAVAALQSPTGTTDNSPVSYCDFLASTAPIETFDTIVGNPPFVRTKRGNLYIDFISKCVDLLRPGGELVFVVPSDFFKLTRAATTINYMMARGTFTHVFYPNDEHMFAEANVDVVVFRYCLGGVKGVEEGVEYAPGPGPNTVEYNGVQRYLNNTDGIITFSDSPDNNYLRLGDLFDIYVGIVSGCESVFKNDTLGDRRVLNAHGGRDNYIIPSEFPGPDTAVNDHLLQHKERLLARRIRPFTEKNWFEWGALRNTRVMTDSAGKKCVYVRNMTRLPTIAFTDNVGLFGSGIIMMVPKDGACVSMDKTVEVINSDAFKENYMYSGRFRIGQHQLANARVPHKDVKR